MLFDSHAHYNDERFKDDVDEVLSAMNENNVGLILNSCSSLDEVPDIFAICEKYPFVYASVGIHPHEVSELTEADMDKLKEYAKNPKVKAIGEIGLDYFYDFSPRDIQQKWFARQVDVARELKMPVVVHDREAHKDCMDIMREHKVSEVGGVFHCYAGSVDMAKEMGVDYENEDPVVCDPASPKFMDAYFKYLHHPREEEGVDFWWIDWQQGTNTAIPGLDPLWMLNHYHTIHSQKKDGKGLIFSRYAGPGSHRYPVGFSGDTVITWESLDFQPYFTATASNIGYGWWSHDIGGHMMGYKNDELSLRWLQLGVFSPIMRLHSTCCEFNGKEPWRYRKEVELIMDKFLRLRHQMIPYLHTMNRRASEEGIPLIQPLYYQNPGKWDAFRMKNEYYFGSDIIVNPITQPISTATRMGKVMALLPEGTWIDLFTGTVYNGDRKIELYRSLDSIPVLAKAGAIVTLDARTTGNAIDNPEILKVIVAAGADGSFRLDEEATDNVWCSTTFAYKWGDEAVLTITPEKTKKEGMPAERAYELVFTGTAQGMTAQKKKADGTYETLETSYDSDKQCTTVILPMQDIESEITVVTYNTALADNHQVERIFELLNRAEIEFSLKEQIYAIAQKKGSRNDAYLLDQLTLLNAPEDVFGAVKEILTALD